MRNKLTMLIGLALLCWPLASAAQIVDWTPSGDTGPGRYFDQVHNAAYAWDALEELSGVRPAEDATPRELAQATLDLLNSLPAYGQKETAQVKPAIPEWLLDGYRKLQPTCVAHSRYLDAVIRGDYAPKADIGTLYAFWCSYDAEWFALSRHADYKAWLSALLLDYPPAWDKLRGDSESALHDRLVVPLQTRDEPYREIDNWIRNFTGHNEAFAKPKVRDVLVGELLSQAGLDADARFFEDEAYRGPTPEGLGLTQRKFYLLAALTLEFFQEIYELDPATKQPLYFRDYFVNVFYKESK